MIEQTLMPKTKYFNIFYLETMKNQWYLLTRVFDLI